MALTVKRVEKLISAGVPGKHTDGKGGVKGLMLCIEGKTSAHWLLRWQRDGRVRHMGLGSADPNELPLAAARERAIHYRQQIARGMDPLELKRKDRERQQQAEAKRLTFKEASERCHEALAAGWSNTRHADEFLSSLRRWVYPHIGSLDIAAVGKDEVLRVLEQKLPSKMGQGGGTFWTGRSQTADRTRSRIERVLDWAEARGFRPAGTPNPARWKGFLDQLLAKPRRIAPVKNMSAVPYDQLPAVMKLLTAGETVGAQALRFIVLTASRMNEVLGARWDEIDLRAAQWTIPASRMKSRREHCVPLSPQAMELLRSLYREQDNPHLFVSPKTPGMSIAEATVTAALRNAGRKETVHGMRASFKTWSEERTNFPNIIAELSLAHSVGTAVEQAYRRTDLAIKRRKLMEAWAKYCCTPPQKADEKTVVPMHTHGSAR
jgi:integrase